MAMTDVQHMDRKRATKDGKGQQDEYRESATERWAGHGKPNGAEIRPNVEMYVTSSLNAYDAPFTGTPRCTRSNYHRNVEVEGPEKPETACSDLKRFTFLIIPFISPSSHFPLFCF